MKNRKWFQACMAGVLSAAMLTTSVSVWGAEFTDGAEAQSTVEVQSMDEETPVVQDEEFASEAARAAETAINSTTFPDTKFRNYVLEKIDTNKNKSLSDSEKKAVKELYLQNMGIGNLKGVEYFAYLEGLFVPGNQLKSVKLSSNKNLKNINISNNKLTGTLDLRYCSKMETINYSYNALTRVLLPETGVPAI